MPPHAREHLSFQQLYQGDLEQTQYGIAGRGEESKGV